MTSKPILFSGPMVRAILDGRKTQTRRVLKPQPEPPPMEGGKWHVRNRHGGCFCPERDIGTIAVPYCPIAEGDELWVREAFNVYCFGGDDCTITYEADKRYWQVGPVSGIIPDPSLAAYFTMLDKLRGKKGGRNFPSIHMPRWASRITLRVTAVKVERLQDISEEDAKAEGVEPHPKEPEWWSSYTSPDNFAPFATHSFATLWEAINGPSSWDANPWVAAYSFERIKP